MTVKRYSAWQLVTEGAPAEPYVLAADHDALIAAKDTVLDALNNELNVYVKHIGAKDAEIAGLQRELLILREFAGGKCVAQKVIDDLGPHSLWSYAALEKHIASRITALETENAALHEVRKAAGLLVFAARRDSWPGWGHSYVQELEAALKAAADKTGEHHGN